MTRFCSADEARAFARPLAERPTFGSRPRVGKKLGAERGVLIRLLRRKIPCASRRGGAAPTVLCSLRFQFRSQSLACAIHGFGARRCEIRFNTSGVHRLARVLLRDRGDPSPRPSEARFLQIPAEQSGKVIAKFRRFSPTRMQARGNNQKFNSSGHLSNRATQSRISLHAAAASCQPSTFTHFPFSRSL